MRAAVITQPGSVELVAVDDPAPGAREVVVEVAATGLCGTDLHILQGEFAPKLPIIPGHEFAGEVVAVGSAVTELAVGARVAVDPSLYCFECHYCRTGHNNLCERWAAIGVTHPGAAAEFVAAPVANCAVLPDGVRTEDAALIEPLSCAVRGYDVLRSRLASRVLIYGAGTMGLMMLQLAKATGAASVDLVDLNAERLDTARKLGCSAAAASADELDRPNYGWDLVVDATGNAHAIQDALGRVGKGGTYLQFGVADYATRATIEPYKIYNQEITITGSMAVLHSFERAADLFATGVIDPDVFISDRLPLAAFPDAIARFQAGIGRKIQIQPGLATS
ncbi:zinc-dependent alcohol dehydrogenase family protein [Streptomyces fulvoviolaceus]|uniref:zinc-dependent alcohol dehydrogenase family protein n=1 Tax=Streptomyces fulvoviolaceus TaxID=285535 RepID=UPI0004C6AFA8|nr:zinc-dependent alcohol dehydrogenase family protein [Streptomyces fulvoviolaceus]MCT9078691.1 zinc-dependent alcohol dehydrogenase family protein [Streptomyces fulvoviolaceus]